MMFWRCQELLGFHDNRVIDSLPFFGFINWVDNINWLLKEFLTPTFFSPLTQFHRMTFVGTLFIITLAESFDTYTTLILIELKGILAKRMPFLSIFFICSLVFFSTTTFSTSFSLRTFEGCSFDHAAFSVWFSRSHVV